MELKSLIKNGYKINHEDENYIENYIEKLSTQNYTCKDNKL
jgi:hypothetical protein